MHRVYWAEKCSVTVERSVKFNIEEDDIPVPVPLEGEWEDVDIEQSSSPPPLSPYKATIEEIPDPKAPPSPRIDAEPIEGRLKRIHKESEYLRRLRDGEGVTSKRPSAPTLPQGIQEGNETGDMADDWEMVSMEDFAIAAVTESAEGLMPDYAEAK